MNPKLSNFGAMIKDKLLLWSDESMAFRNKSLSTSSPIKLVNNLSNLSNFYQTRQSPIKLVQALNICFPTSQIMNPWLPQISYLHHLFSSSNAQRKVPERGTGVAGSFIISLHVLDKTQKVDQGMASCDSAV